MAPSEPNQKRKRGRRAGASTTTATAASLGPSKQAPARRPETTQNGAIPDAAPRKRGRPRKISYANAENGASSVAAQPSQAGGTPETAPRKRGRPKKDQGAEPAEQTSIDPRPRKRRRADGAEEAADQEQSRDQRELSDTSTDKRQKAAESEDLGRVEGSSRRSRRDQQPDDSPVEPPPQKQRGKKAQQDKDLSKPTEARSSQNAKAASAEDASARRGRRERRSADGNPWEGSANQAASEASRAGKEQSNPSQKPKRGRGRPSLAEMSVSKAQNKTRSPESEKQGGKKRTGRRPPSSSAADTQTQNTSRASPPAASEASHPAKKQSKAKPPAAETNDSPAPSPSGQAEPPAAGPAYRHLTARTRQIPRSTITSKWAPLDAASISAIDSIIADASRAVLHRLRDRDQRHAQAQTILRAFAARLRGKLHKGMPFPPSLAPGAPPSHRSGINKKTAGRGGNGRNSNASGNGTPPISLLQELEFDRTVEAIRALERALDPALHSVALLEREREREERALERDYRALRQLEANARAQKSGWRERGRREHVLVPPVAGHGDGDGGEGPGFGLEIVKREEEGAEEGRGGGGLFKDLQEEELVALSQQIGSHMESMRANLSQIEGVLPAIAKSRAALQGTLCEYLDEEQYAQVLLG